MRKTLLIALFVMMPMTAWGGDASKVNEQKIAEEDICMAQAEYSEAKDAFYSRTGGMTDMNSNQARYATDYKRKRLRYGQVLQRFSQQNGKEFDGICTRSGQVMHIKNATPAARAKAPSQ